jgi:hypothetical protein
VSYLAALIVVARIFPDRAGARARIATALRASGLLAVLLLAGLLAEWKLGHALSLTLRVLLAPVGLWAVFALRLIRREDLDKLAAIQLRWGPLRAVRDGVVQAAGLVARIAEPGMSR